MLATQVGNAPSQERIYELLDAKRNQGPVYIEKLDLDLGPLRRATIEAVSLIAQLSRNEEGIDFFGPYQDVMGKFVRELRPLVKALNKLDRSVQPEGPDGVFYLDQAVRTGFLVKLYVVVATLYGSVRRLNSELALDPTPKTETFGFFVECGLELLDYFASTMARSRKF